MDLLTVGLVAGSDILFLLFGVGLGQKFGVGEGRRIAKDSFAVELRGLEIQKQELEKRLALTEQELGQVRGQLTERTQELQNRLSTAEGTIDDLRGEISSYQKLIAELKMERKKDIELIENERKQLEINRFVFKQEFENLANKIFESKQRLFSEQSKQGLDSILLPLKDQLESFRRRVDEVHTQNVEGSAGIRAELDRLRELNQTIGREATNLTRALKGDRKLQGSWGEHKVELLLEQAGLRKGIEYEREMNFKDEDNNNRRPDFVVFLPDKKHIIIDSKVSLNAYSSFVSADSDEERQAALAAHVQALRNHVADLAGKNYPELTGMNSPDFVFLFVAIEPAYLAAAEHSPALFQDAYEKRIAIVTATTLLPVLRVVANLWSLQRQNQSTKKLADQAGSVYEKLRIFVERMERLGRQINTVKSTYDETFNVLKDGRGSLTKQVDKFVDLGIKITKRLPASVTNSDSEDGDPSSGSDVAVDEEDNKVGAQ